MATEQDKQLIHEFYKAHGIDDSRFVDYGESNIYIQCFANLPEDDDEAGARDDGDKYRLSPTIYTPNKAVTWDGELYDLNDPEVKEEYLGCVRDSIERMKIYALLLQKHIEEIEHYGYPVTNVVYPEVTMEQIREWNVIEKEK